MNRRFSVLSVAAWNSLLRGLFSFLALGPLLSGAAAAAALTVTTANDSGPGSLRQTVEAAAAGDTIVFGQGLLGQTILLVSPISLDGKSLTIQGPGAENLAISGGGSAQLFDIGWGASATVTLERLTLRDGRGEGGAISVAGGSGEVSLVVRDAVLTGHYNSAISMVKGSLSVFDSTLTDNHDQTPSGGGGGGGAIVAFQEVGAIVISGSTFYGNTSGDQGGALLIDGKSDLLIVNSTLSGNAADTGGALLYSAGGQATILNTTVTNNTAAANDGAGGIQIGGGTLSIGNSLIGGNVAAVPGQANLARIYGGAGQSFGNNLIGQDGVSGVLDVPLVASDLILTGGIVTAIEPLAANGGPTLTHLLVSGSPALNAGNNALVPTDVSTDQRGQPRIQDGVVDIGAVEGDRGQALEYDAQVFTLFIGYFGRPPSPDGRDYYGQVMNDSDGNWAIIADDFWNSSESQALYPPSSSTRDQINSIYRNLFSRDATADGLDYWEGLITAGVVSLPEMAYTIAYNASADDLAVLDAKRVTAERWTDSLDTAEEQAAFATDAGRQAARDFLATVSSANPASQAAVDQAIADMVAG